MTSSQSKLKAYLAEWRDTGKPSDIIWRDFESNWQDWNRSRVHYFIGEYVKASANESQTLVSICQELMVALERVKLTGYSDHVKLRSFADQALSKADSMIKEKI